MAAMRTTVHWHRLIPRFPGGMTSSHFYGVGKKRSCFIEDLEFASNRGPTLPSRVSATPTEHHVMPGARLPKSVTSMKSLLWAGRASTACNISWGPKDACYVQLALSD